MVLYNMEIFMNTLMADVAFCSLRDFKHLAFFATLLQTITLVGWSFVNGTCLKPINANHIHINEPVVWGPQIFRAFPRQQKISILGTILFHLRVDDLSSWVWFEKVSNLRDRWSLGTPFIYHSIRGVFWVNESWCRGRGKQQISSSFPVTRPSPEQPSRFKRPTKNFQHR